MPWFLLMHAVCTALTLASPLAPTPPRLVSAFGSGVCFSLVSGMGKPGAQPGSGTANPLMAAFSAGVVFALFQGAFYKVPWRVWCLLEVEEMPKMA